MNQEDDYYDLESLFDKPKKKLKKHKPKYCSICGFRSDLLKEYVVGKTTLYVCFICANILEEPRNLIKEDQNNG